MGGGFKDRGSTGDGGDGVDEVGGIESFVAHFAGIAELVGRFAEGTGAFDETIGQEDVGLGIVKLFDAFSNEIAGEGAAVDLTFSLMQ